jgi:hypothetical protein
MQVGSMRYSKGSMRYRKGFALLYVLVVVFLLLSFSFSILFLYKANIDFVRRVERQNAMEITFRSALNNYMEKLTTGGTFNTTYTANNVTITKPGDVWYAYDNVLGIRRSYKVWIYNQEGFIKWYVYKVEESP